MHAGTRCSTRNGREEVTTDTFDLYPSGGDDTAQINTALGKIGPRGGKLIFHVGVFNIPNGIISRVPGLVVEGIGHRTQGPGYAGSDVGTSFQTTTAWCWQQLRALNAGGNDYRGPLFRGINFIGGPATAGGLYSEVAYTQVENCDAKFHTTGRGFYFCAPAISGGSAQECVISHSGATDCLTGLTTATADGTAIHDFVTLKTSARGIHGTGTGIEVLDNNTRIIGGKVEGNATGVLVRSVPGISIMGMLAEDNGLDCDLDKGTTTGNWTSNVVCASFGTVRVGPWNFGDRVIGTRYPRIVTDVPNPQGIVKGTVQL